MLQYFVHGAIHFQWRVDQLAASSTSQSMMTLLTPVVTGVNLVLATLPHAAPSENLFLAKESAAKAIQMHMVRALYALIVLFSLVLWKIQM